MHSIQDARGETLSRRHYGSYLILAKETDHIERAGDLQYKLHMPGTHSTLPL